MGSLVQSKGCRNPRNTTHTHARTHAPMFTRTHTHTHNCEDVAAGLNVRNPIAKVEKISMQVGYHTGSMGCGIVFWVPVASPLPGLNAAMPGAIVKYADMMHASQ